MFISSTIFNESLRNTILLAAIDDTRISVLIAGVLPYMEININETVEQYNQSMIMFYEMHYNNAFGGISFVATTYGPFLDCKQRELRPPAKEPREPGQGCHTLLFTVKFEMDESLWDAALRYIRLLFAFNLYSISLDTTKRNWTTQINTLHTRFDTKTKALKIGDVLLEMLLSGSTDAAGEAFLERGMGMDGLAGIREFTERHMAEVSRLSRGQLASSARNLAFQRCEFSTAIKRSELYNSLKNDDCYLYEEEEVGPGFSNPWLTKLEEQIDILDVKTRQLGVQCLTMMQELGHITKWISLTKPFAKSMKVNALMKIKRMDIAKVLDYVVSNFIPDQEVAKEIFQTLFKLTDRIEEQKKKDKEAGFNELEYLEQLEQLVVEEREKLIETFHVKFKFASFADKEDGWEMKKEIEDVENIQEVVPREDPVELVEETVELSCDLDRVGSFFEKELSAKALQVLPSCSKQFDMVLEKRGNRMNDISVRKMGLAKVLEDLADTISAPQKLSCDKTGKPLKPEVVFVYEIASDKAHQGYLDVKMTDVTPSFFGDHEFLQVPGMARSMQVIVIEKKLLSSMVLVPTADVSFSHQKGITKHIEAMRREYKIENLRISELIAIENLHPDDQEAMEVDRMEGEDLRINVDVESLQPEYNTLVEYNKVFPLRHGELIAVGKFASSQPGTGLAPRLLRSVASYPYRVPEQKNILAVHNSDDGKMDASIDMMIVHPTTQMTAFLHDDGSKITIGDMKPGRHPTDEERVKPNRKTFRDYQRRREKYREDIGGGNLSDIQYDVLVQEAMDNGRDLTGNGDPDDDYY
uniref:Uncharacterized protein n=3 Tax=Caenorhabditis japonica TaxID=281687 RepID=A0A8R1HS95_CAEJA